MSYIICTFSLRGRRRKKSKQFNRLTLGSYFNLNDKHTSIFFDVHWIDILFSLSFSLSLFLIPQLLLLELPPAIRGVLSLSLVRMHRVAGKSQAIHQPLCVQWSVSSIVVPTTLSIDNKNWKYVCMCMFGLVIGTLLPQGYLI